MNDRHKKFGGVNVAGHFSASFGLAEGAKSTVQALQAAAIPFVLNNFPQDVKALDTTHTNFSKINHYPINIVHTNPDLLNQIIMKKNTDFKIHQLKYFWNKYNIGVWAWEMSSIPNNWRSSFYLFDEVWATSHYTAKAISRYSSLPVTVIPHSISFSDTSVSRSALTLPKNKFVFLFIFDEMSGYTRKNPQAVIQAFKQAFQREDSSVVLVLKTRNLQAFHKQELQQLALNSPPIIFLEQDVSRQEIHGLIKNCDCYVSLHRAEGFGLTMAEAMYCGKPVIATAYSANLDFMNSNNSFLIDYKLVPLARILEPTQKGTSGLNPIFSKRQR